MLSIKNVTVVEKSGRKLLNNVSIEVREGDFIAVSGDPIKSEVLISVLGGLQSVTSGEVLIDGIEISKYTFSQLTTLRREKFAYFLSDSTIDTSLTVRENVELPLLFADVESTQMEARVERAVQIVGMSDFIDVSASQLSNWQKNKLAIVLMLVKNPQVIIINEPLRVLDLTKIPEITGLLSALNREGITIIVATQLEEIRAGFKRKLEIQEDGTITEIKKERAPRKLAEEKPKTKRTTKPRIPKDKSGETLVESDKTSNIQETVEEKSVEEIPELDVKPVKTRKPRAKKMDSKE